MKKAIKGSYRHVGIEPFDRGRIEQMIRNEKPNSALLNDPLVSQAVVLVEQKLNEFDNLITKKRKRDGEEKAKKRVKKNATLNTAFALVLTNSEPLAELSRNSKYSEILKMKAEVLHQEMILLGFKDEDIRKPGKSQYKSVKELRSMIKEKFDDLQKELQLKIEREIQKRLAVPPNFLAPS